MSANADQIAYWSEVAGPKWVASQAALDRLMAPLTDALIAAAAPQPGERVLDVGCGCGDLALRLASSCGAAGDVLAVDVSPPMLAHAATRPATGAPIEWRRADAMSEMFVGDRDLLVSRFGVMFFDDRSRAFANLCGAVRPGGRFAFLTWRGRAEVEWMSRPLEWIAPAVPPPELRDGEIGPFGLADAEATCALLEAAGFRDVRAGSIDRSLVIGETVEDAFAMLAETGPAAGAMREADDAERKEALRLLRNALQAAARADGRVLLEGACWLYEGGT